MMIPDYVKNAIKELETAGFEAFAVGGCVRDLLLEREAKDWDVTTNARPEDILKVFPDGKYENVFGTVMVPKKYLVTLPIISQNVKINDEQKEKLITAAKKYITEISCEAHGIKHAENVALNALEIAKEYKQINLAFIEAAAYFHDTGRSKFSDERHIDESKKIFKKELAPYIDKNDLDILIEIIQHDHESPSQSLEQEVIREADIIDGIDIERVKIVNKIGLAVHSKWIKERFNDENYFSLFVIPKSRELLSKSIDEFNKSDFDYKIPEIKVGSDEVVEVTTYRSEQGYSDRRHPDEVRFEDSLDKDLERRDFTINSLAMKFKSPLTPQYLFYLIIRQQSSLHPSPPE